MLNMDFLKALGDAAYYVGKRMLMKGLDPKYKPFIRVLDWFYRSHLRRSARAKGFGPAWKDWR